MCVLFHLVGAGIINSIRKHDEVVSLMMIINLDELKVP